VYKVTYDNIRNIITVKIWEDFNIKQAEDLHTHLEQIVPRCKKGFRVLTDLSLLKNMEQKAHRTIEKSMELYDQYGVSKVIRIIPDPAKDIGFNIMSLFHYARDVKIHTCQSIKEAQKYLL